MRAAPDFLGIGAPRAGTTWLHAQLLRHPDVWLPPVKEIHYFNRAPHYGLPDTLATSSPWQRLVRGEMWQRKHYGPFLRSLSRLRPADVAWGARWYLGTFDDDWYRRLFPEDARYRVRGEITPNYSMLDRDGVAAIARMNPEVKILYLLRDPVERLWSEVTYHTQRGRIGIDLTDASSILAFLEDARVMWRLNDYVATIDLYREFFPSEQVLVGFYDSVVHEPAVLMQRVRDFLGIESTPALSAGIERRVNASKQQEIPTEVLEYMRERLDPMIEATAERVGGYATRWVRSSPPSDRAPLGAPVLHP